MPELKPFTSRTAFTHLRHLTVYVDEPDRGQYFWVLMESVDDSTVWHKVHGSEDCFGAWIEAHNASVVELLKQVDDEWIGPRAPGAEDESANPVG